MDLAKDLTPEDVPGLLGDLEVIRLTALARIASRTIEIKPDELLDVAQASKRMNVSPSYLYRHAGRLPFTRREGRKLLFSSAGMDKYLAAKR